MKRMMPGLVLAILAAAGGCYESARDRDDVTSDPAPDPSQDPAADHVADTAPDPVSDPLPDPAVDPEQEPDLVPPPSCPERIIEPACNALPPECPEGYFPGSDGMCWTGQCLHCIDGCQSDEDCVAVQVCGCGYHEGCGWAETRFRFALETDSCIQLITSPCPGACWDVLDCPPACGEDVPPRCCGWCDPPDDTECQGGECVEIITHMCM